MYDVMPLKDCLSVVNPQRSGGPASNFKYRTAVVFGEDFHKKAKYVYWKKISFLSFSKFCLLGVFLCDLNFDSYIIFSHSGNVSLTKQQDSTQ